MHLEETYTGFMRIASNRDGKPYKDWREHYIDSNRNRTEYLRV